MMRYVRLKFRQSSQMHHRQFALFLIFNIHSSTTILGMSALHFHAKFNIRVVKNI
jgi:hypothetical protein